MYRLIVIIFVLASVLASIAGVAGQSSTVQSVVGVTTELPRTPDCTMVELRPGFPGYRGNVTGMMPHAGGTADYECLERLLEIDPSFDKEREDRANQQAANALGITGSQDLWVWENWMQIESVRGWLPSCYTCLMTQDAGPPFNSGVQAAPNDYRNLVGFMGRSQAISTLAIRHQLDPTTRRMTLDAFQNDDYVLRAKGFGWAGPLANARQLLEAYDVVLDEMWTPGGRYLDMAHIGNLVFSSSGYAYTPASTDPLDQMLTMYYGLLSVEAVNLDVLVARFNRDIDGWYAVLWTSSPPFPSLAEYMQQQSFWQNFRP